MIRAWIGIALLAGAWLLGLNYYYAPNYVAWTVVVLLGAVLLSGSTRVPLAACQPGRGCCWLLARRWPCQLCVVLLLIPAIWLSPWPYRLAPLFIAAGVLLQLPIPRRWTRSLGQGAIAAGTVMLAQALTMEAYANLTARSHDLPWPLPDMLAGIARLLGIDAVADGSTIVMHSMRQVQRLGATWDLLLDPATLCFFVGSLVLLALVAWSRASDGSRWSAWIRALRILTLILVVWLPIRAGLLMAVYLHRVLRFDPEQPLHVMDVFLSPWVHLLLLLGPVLLAWRFVRLPSEAAGEAAGTAAPTEGAEAARTAGPAGWRTPVAAAVVMLAVAVLTTAVVWDPVGQRQGGRVMVVERHSTWEPTTRPYDTKWFGHDSGYNYAAAYDYCNQYFQMSRLLETDKIDDQTLQKCDVLVIKIPTTEAGLPPPKDPGRYTKDEVEAVLRFVNNGGGLLLIGDHTNVFKCGTYLNDIARPMGFTFRHDLLFGTGKSPYEQRYHTPLVPHPIVQDFPWMDFAVSCSVDPGRSAGRAVIVGTGLWSLPAAYNVSNYHPMPQHRPEMRFGAFIELWSTRYGKGRVLAFADSTIFSNFAVFQPSKAELLRGMIEWLNHRAPADPRPWLLPIGAVLLLAGVWLARARQGAWLLLLAAGLLGWVIASVGVAAIDRRAMPVPKPLSPERQMVPVVIDRTVSEVLFSNGAFVQGDGAGYGLFEQWISRLDTPQGKLYTVRRSGPEAFSGKALVVISPTRSVSREFREGLVDFVAGGGRLLVIDSPDNAASTANSLLWPFGLSIHHDRPTSGALTLKGNWPNLRIADACEVTGGRPVAYVVGGKPVGAMANYKKGTAVAIGFGSFFSDAGMGYLGETAIWAVRPTADMIFTYSPYLRYNVEFALLRALMSGQPVDKFYSGQVVMDRTVSHVKLPSPDAATYEDDEYGQFEHWIHRLGYSAREASGEDALTGDLLVVLLPTGQVSDEFRDKVARYVHGGGKLLVVDSPTSAASTANELLEPFGLSVDHDVVQGGKLLLVEKYEGNWPNPVIEPACRVSGGKALASIAQVPVAATVEHGKGAVTAVGFGSMFINTGMFASWDLPPPTPSLVPYDLETALIRSLMTSTSFLKCVPSVSD